MNKKDAIQAMLDGKRICNTNWSNSTANFYWNRNWFISCHGVPVMFDDMHLDEGWEIYEEPLKEEAPEYVDIEVELELDGGFYCDGWGLGSVIGKSIERHDTRYFAFWYIVNTLEATIPCMKIGDTPTFASHVRFVREDLLGGISK